MKVLFVATVVKTHIMEFHLPYLRMFKELGWETAVAARNDYENPAECVIPYCDTFLDIPFERNPVMPGNIRAYRMLKKAIDEGGYDIIHCHTPVGGMLARMAAGKARRRGCKVLYTAHGFHFFKGAPLVNWLLYYPPEKLMARRTDVLITINREDYQRAQGFRAGRVEYVPGVGVDLSRFRPDPSARAAKRKELGLGEDDFVLLSVGELNPNKNQTTVLHALQLLKQEGRLDHVHYLLVGRGVSAGSLQQEARDLGVAEHAHFLGYRRDVQELCNCSDLFVFMSLREGLPVALMEAMACGLPAIASAIRGNTDLIRSGENGELIENSPEGVAEAVRRLREDPALCRRYGAAAAQSVQAFALTEVQARMKEIYDSVCPVSKAAQGQP